MQTILLLQKLHAMKKAISTGDADTLDQLVQEAEELTLQIQRDSPEQRRRESRLHLQSVRI